MKIYNEEINLEGPRIILTQSPFKLINNICLNNKEVLVITPWSKISDIFNYKKNNYLYNMINEEFESLPSEILNINLILEKINQIEKDKGFELFDFDERSQKIIKDHFGVSEKIISNEDLLNIIKFMNRYSRVNSKIIIAGFDNLAIKIINLNCDKLDLIVLTTSLSNSQFTLTYIESLILSLSNDEIIQIFDIDVFRLWLESKSETVIENQDIEDYLNNVINNKTLLLEKVFKNL